MRLAVPIKVISQRFALPILVLASVVMIVLGKADTLLFERLRSGFADSAAPALRMISQPVAAVDAVVGEVRGLFTLRSDNARLREDNERLLRWQQVAQGLGVENARLRDLVKLTPDPSASFVTGRVIANSGGAFVRSVLIDAGGSAGIVRGQAAVTGEGLVGRITETGDRTSRVLLVTDLNSRLPVVVDGSRERAVLAGDNSDEPRLLYLPTHSAIKVGDRLVTSGNGGIFPPGLPVGLVSAVTDGIVRVQPYAELSRLDFLRIVDYGLTGMLPQAVTPRPAKPGRGAASRAP
jgi:rod shape-determining protein MreC